MPGSASKEFVAQLRSAPGPQDDLQLPVRPNLSSLPLQALSWENFERLCVRLTELDERVSQGRLYGERGQDQGGIDLYGARVDNDKYVVYQ